MADYKAVFAKPRRIASAISSYFVRSSNGTDRATSGTYSTVSSGTPAFDRKDGLILEASRIQLLYNTGFSGAASGTPGTTPTAWARDHSGGTTVITALDLGNSIQYTVTSARHFDRQNIPVSANTTYVLSSVILAFSGTIHPQEVVTIVSLPAGATISYRYAGVSVAANAVIGTAGSVLECILTVAGTAGTVSTRVGISCSSGSWTGSVTHAYPIFEAGAFRSSYIYNTNTGATLTRAASYLGPIPVGDMGIASQTNEYSFAIAVRFPYSSSAGGTGYPRIASLGATAGNTQFELLTNRVNGSISVVRTEAGVYAGEIGTSPGEMSWAANELVFLRFSNGATNGLILVSTRPDGTTYTDTNTAAAHKAAMPHAITGLVINGQNVSNAISAPDSVMTVVGFRVWDSALTQAQLEALTVADLDGSTYLTSWATELGSDPPATVTISDENITTGSLDWWRFGESADTSENTKSASYATYLGGSANINTPAFGRYAGSTDKQAPLITYTDGTSPSSGSSRAYSSTGVASAGRRNVVTSQGKPLWIHILAGGYDGVHQHVLTTSDSSSPVHTRTNTTGATTVKFWETIVYWGGANGSTLQIDSTAVSGSVGLQLAAITVFPVDPTIVAVSPTSPYPGQSVTATMLGMAEVATTATYDGAASPTVGSPTLTSVPLTWPARSTFRFAGTHASVRFGVNKNLVIGNGYESSAGYGVSTTAEQLAGFGARDSGAAAYDLGTWNSGAITLATSDEVWGHVTVGSAAVNAPAVDFTPYEDPTTVEWTYFDISAGSWSGLTTTTFTESFALTIADTTLTPGQTVRATLSGGTFAGAVTAAYIVYGEYSIPISWTVIDADETDLTMPNLSAFVAGQTAERLRWYDNFTLRIEADEEYAESPNTNQVVAPVPGDFGTAAPPPWGYPPSGAQEGDDVYIHTVSGTLTATPETFDVTLTTDDARALIYTYDVSGLIWLEVVDTSYIEDENIVMPAVRPIVKSVVEVIT